MWRALPGHVLIQLQACVGQLSGEYLAAGISLASPLPAPSVPTVWTPNCLGKTERDLQAAAFACCHLVQSQRQVQMGIAIHKTAQCWFSD